MKSSRLSHYISLASSASYRYASGTYLLEGSELIHEFVSQNSPVHVKSLCMSRDFHLNKLPNLAGERKAALESVLANFAANDPAYLKSYQINRITDSNSEGIVAEIEMIDHKFPKKNILILDGIRNPGNMGALLRSAVYFNWDTVVVIPEAADPFGVACVRAARNAQSYVGIETIKPEGLEEIFSPDRTLFLAIPSPVERLNLNEYGDLMKAGSKVLILGSESHGISEKLRNHCREAKNVYEVNVLNLNPKQMESLNVSIAGSILMSKLQDLNANEAVQISKLNRSNV
ncbi:hypothetical protein MDAP_000816 [Mitosporidium daphniae]